MAGPERICDYLIAGRSLRLRRDRRLRLGERGVHGNLGGVDTNVVGAGLGVHGVLDLEADCLGGAVAAQGRLDPDKQRILAVDPGALVRGAEKRLKLVGVGASERDVAGLGRGALEVGKCDDCADLEVHVGGKLDREGVVEAGVGRALLDLLDDEGGLLHLHGGQVLGVRGHGPRVSRAHRHVHVHGANDLPHLLVVGRDLDYTSGLHLDGVVHQDLDHVGGALTEAVGFGHVEHQVHGRVVPHGREVALTGARESVVVVRRGEVAAVDAHVPGATLLQSVKVNLDDRVHGDGHVGLERHSDGVEAARIRRRLADVLDGELGRRLGAGGAGATLDLEGERVPDTAHVDGPLADLDGLEAEGAGGAKGSAVAAVANLHVDDGRGLLAAAVGDFEGDGVIGVGQERGEVERQHAGHLVPRDALLRGGRVVPLREVDDGREVRLRTGEARERDPVLGVRAVARHRAGLDGHAESEDERDGVLRRGPGARMDQVRHGDLGFQHLEGPHVGVGLDHLAAGDDDTPLAADVDVAGADARGLGVLHAQGVADREGKRQVLPGKDLVADVEGQGARRVVPQALVADHAVELGREVGSVVGLGHVVAADHHREVRESDGTRGARHRRIKAVEHRDGDDGAVRQVDVGADRYAERVVRAGQVGRLLNVARDEGGPVAAQRLHVARDRLVDGARVAPAGGGGEGGHPRGARVEAGDVGRRSVGGVVGERVGLLDHGLGRRGEARCKDPDARRRLRLDGVADVEGENGAGAQVSDDRELHILLHAVPHAHAGLAGRGVGAKVGRGSAAQGKVPGEALCVGEAHHRDAHGAVHGGAKHGHVGRERDRERVLGAGPCGALPDAPGCEHGVLGHEDARALVQLGLANATDRGAEVRVEVEVGELGLERVRVDHPEDKIDLLTGDDVGVHAHLERAGTLLPLGHVRVVDERRRHRRVHLAHRARPLQAANRDVGLGLDGDVQPELEREIVLEAGVLGRLGDILVDPLGAAHEEGRRLHILGLEDARELGSVLDLVHGGVGRAGE
mmetsp:Transcript_25404/g.64436  ORF Transcript_25404/g.64436 Transcript_25404/m.64436 type:complete len:1028 (+) Transcript_25404:4763-7846(+)